MNLAVFASIRSILGPVVSFATDQAQREGEKESTMNLIADLLCPEDILLNVDIQDRSQLFAKVGRHMQLEHALSQEWVAGGLARREQIGSTGLGEGVAIPHARVKDLDRIRLAYLRLKAPISFDAPDGKPVSDVLALLVPKQATEEHLQILAEAAHMLSERRFREQLHLCGNAGEVKQLFGTWPPSDGATRVRQGKAT